AAALLAASSLSLWAQEDREALEAELEQLRTRIAAVQAQIDERLGERDRLDEQLAEAEREVGRARRAQVEASQALRQTRAEIDQLEARQATLENRVGERASELALQLTSAYRQGSRSRLAMLLNQDDPRHLS